MKKFISISVLLLYTLAFSQVGIGTNSPDSSSILDLDVSSYPSNQKKGFLPPRITEPERDLIDAVPGLVIYNTTIDCLEYWNSTQWIGLCEEEGPSGPIDGLLFACSSSTRNGWIEKGIDTSSRPVTFTIPYNGGDGVGQSYPEIVINSTGAGTNLTATLNGGVLNTTGNFVFEIGGTPTVGGEYHFNFEFGGQSCNFTLSTCGAYIAPGVWKDFMCHNLGADFSLDPYTPEKNIHGAKYQWGRQTPILTQAQDQANPGAIPGWNTSPAPNGAWSDLTKTVNDPCPVGFRVPTTAQWQAVISNNNLTGVGTFSNNSNNYSSGTKIGTGLFLPTSGFRESETTLLNGRGSVGFLTHSTLIPPMVNTTGFGNGTATATFYSKLNAAAIRCVAE